MKRAGFRKTLRGTCDLLDNDRAGIHISFQAGTGAAHRPGHAVFNRAAEGAQQADPAYVIDGKQISKKEFENLDPANIKSMTVVKGGTQEDVKKYDGWENGVILVETKEGAKKK